MLFCSDLGNGTYDNPVLYGDYSDPDAIRIGDDYYIISSSFTNTPGIPVLHSKDLVNWQTVNYVLENLPDESYRKVRHGCGVWAPSIRFHKNLFYVYFPMPDEGIYVCTASDPRGKWSEPVMILSEKGYIDPCPFWDEDGSAYLVCALAGSRAGRKSVLLLSPMARDGMSLTDDFRCIYDGNNTENDTIEGPKLYKRNGYYYVFAPAGGVKAGHQVVLRSQSIYGPYDYRIVLKQGNSPVNGPHQGAWVDTPAGEHFFLHFQDVYAGGRIVHLQPMRWENDWPVIGAAASDETCGEPVMNWSKPTGSSTNTPAFRPECSDSFPGPSLALQWQWNANHSSNWYRINEDGLHLCAFPMEKDLALCDCPALLLQKWPAPEFVCKTVMDFSLLKPGECAGIVSLGTVYGGLGIRLESSDTSLKKEYNLVSLRGELTYGMNTSLAKEEETLLPFSVDETNNTDTRIELTVTVRITGYEDVLDRTDYLGREQWVRNVPVQRITLSSNLKETTLTAFEIPAVAGRWVGVKCGVFCINKTAENHPGGGVIVKSVTYSSLSESKNPLK